MGKRRGRV